MRIAVLYVGSSLLAPLRNAEQEINRRHGLELRVAAHNFGALFSDEEWNGIEADLREAEVVFVIHVMDGENAARLMSVLDRFRNRHRAVVVINCMPALMKRTRMGKLDFENLPGVSRKDARNRRQDTQREVGWKGTSLMASIVSWIGRQARGKGSKGSVNGHGRGQYLKFANRLPSLLRFVPSAGALRDVKNYLMLFCYFLQPSPRNIRSMLLYALKHYLDDERVRRVEIPAPESLPIIGIYHPDASSLFESFDAYRSWYGARRPKTKDQRSMTKADALDPKSTIGLLLMRPQIVSDARKHYDGLIRAIEAEGLSVMPVISTLMDNREACEKFFVQGDRGLGSGAGRLNTTDNRQLTTDSTRKPRVSQIVSLTGFSFVGGPAMNDSEASANFLAEINIPYRSLVSLDTQTIESWRESFTGLNPVQTGMQVAIHEIDGATEPFVCGGIPERGVEPAPLEDRCRRIARRLKRWNDLQIAGRDQLKLALVLYCFPPNKGNIGTAADLDVFASLFGILARFKADGYGVDVPTTADGLREMLLNGNSVEFETNANVAYRMAVDEYRELNP